MRRRRAIRDAAAVRSPGGGRRLRTLVLDMGGVVIPTLFESVAVEGFPDGPLVDEPAYRDVEEGRTGERDYWAAVMESRPDLDIGRLWRSCSRVRGELAGTLDVLASRVRLVAFTNDMSHWFGAGWERRFPQLVWFDEVLEASRLGVLKPEPASFTRAMAEIGEDPSRALFVDDLATNLDGAEQVGMATLLFDVRDPAGSVRRMLQRLGIAAEPAAPAGAFRVPSVRP